MFRSRYLAFLSIIWLATPGRAATVTTLTKPVSPDSPKTLQNGLGNEALAAILSARVPDIGLAGATASPLLVAAQIAFVVVLGSRLARALPHVRPRVGHVRYAIVTLRASSLIRATIALRPFERWADRWSFRPSRPSSPPASTFKTSRTANPL